VKSTCSWGNIQHAALRGLANSAELIISEIIDRADSSIPYIKQLVKRKPSMVADMIAALHMLLAWQLKLRYAQHDRHAAVAAAVAAASSSQQQQQQQHLLAQANTIPAWHEQFLDALSGHVRDTFEHSERVTGPRALDDTMQALRLLLDVCEAAELSRQCQQQQQQQQRVNWIGAVRPAANASLRAAAAAASGGYAAGAASGYHVKQCCIHGSAAAYHPTSARRCRRASSSSSRSRDSSSGS
jgi:hypothetical protein